jgi:hypothetical protein
MNREQIIKTTDKYFPFKVWATTLFCGPFLGILLNIIRRPDSLDVSFLLGGPFMLALGGVVASAPAFIIYYAVFRFLQKKVQSGGYYKLILCLIAVPGVIGTLYFMVSKEMLRPSNRDGFLLFIAYLFCVLVAGISFRIFKKKNVRKILSVEKQS